VYKWVNRFDGSIGSLKDRSRRPHSGPKSHTAEEIKAVKRALKKVKWQDLILAFQRLQARGYMRSYGGFRKTPLHVQWQQTPNSKHLTTIISLGESVTYV